MIFMDKFFSIFPQYLSDDLYIAGESYAGTYIPYIADAILSRNKNESSTATKYPLKGIMLGNGWIDPVRQYLAYAPFAYKHGLITDGTPEAKRVDEQVTKCMNELNNGVHITVDTCEEILDIILEVSQDKSQKDGKTCRNMYDMRKFDSFPSCGSNWPDDLQYVTPYLRTDEVKTALHISPKDKAGWSECSGAVSRAFQANKSKPTIDMLPSILEQIPVLMFNGDQDLICNHLGNEDLIGQMEWSGAKGFQEAPGGAWAPREAWVYDGVPAGIYQEARNLTYVLVYNASHMVPVDQSLQSRDMLHRFIELDYSSSGEVSKGLIGGNSTASPDGDSGSSDESDKIKDATRLAYFRAGELALVIVSLAAFGFLGFVFYQRRVASKSGYRTVAFAKQDTMIRLEDGAAARGGAAPGSRSADEDDDDDNELDELVVESPVVTSDEIERRLVYDADGQEVIEDDSSSSEVIRQRLSDVSESDMSQVSREV